MNETDWVEAARRKGWAGLPDTPGNFGEWCRWWAHEQGQGSWPDEQTPEGDRKRREYRNMVQRAACVMLTMLSDSLAYDMEPTTEKELVAQFAACLPHQLARWTDPK